jgi:hypothetical protein
MDEVGYHVHMIQNAIDRFIPILQQQLLVFDGFEVDHSVDAVYSTADHVAVVETANLLFAVLPLHSQELAHTRNGQLAVVLTDDADVVLHQHPSQLNKVALNINQLYARFRKRLAEKLK